MRVVGGSAKGLQLRMVKDPGTRPTSDKVREAIFAVLATEIVDATVLDLYAGTGAMAIEALSRGAASAVLVESSRAAFTAIRENLERTGFAGRAQVMRVPVQRALRRLDDPFDIVIADPPYADPGIGDLMTELGGMDRVPIRQGSVVVLEHSRRFAPDAQYGRLALRLAKRYGDTSVSFYSAGEVIR